MPVSSSVPAILPGFPTPRKGEALAPLAGNFHRAMTRVCSAIDPRPHGDDGALCPAFGLVAR